MLEQQLAVGGTYRFTFKPEFVRHGVCPSGTTCLHKGGGVFKVQQICTYVEILQANINLYANFFAPLGYSTDEYQKYYNGKPEDQYTPEYTALQVPVEYYQPSTQVIDGKATEVQEKVKGISHRLVETGKSVRTRHFLEEISYGFNPIYKLIDVVDPDDIVYAPEKTILGVPEIGIREYQNMTLAITVGYWDDASKLDGLILNVRERLAAYGIRPQNLEAFSAESKWMTPEEYDEVVKDRQPGKLVEINSENKSNYTGRTVIVDGEFKKLVDDTVNNPPTLKDNEVGVSKFCQTPGTIIDSIPFMNKVDLSTSPTFEANKRYFVRVTVGSREHERSLMGDDGHRILHYGDEFVELVEGEDYAVGDQLVRYVPYASYDMEVKNKYSAALDKDDTSLKAFIDDGPAYGIILSPKLAKEYLEAGVTLYTDSDSANPGKYVEFTGSDIAEDDLTAYFYKVSEHTWLEYNGDRSAHIGNKCLYLCATTNQDFFFLDYSNTSSSGLDHLGKRFSYITRFNTKVTLDITVDALIGLSNDVEVARIFAEDANLARAYDGRWYTFTKKNGEIFKNNTWYDLYQNRVAILDKTETYVPVDKSSVTVPSAGEEYYKKVGNSYSLGGTTTDSGNLIWDPNISTVYVKRRGTAAFNENNGSNSPGSIVGANGTVWGRCYVTTDNMERSYIKKYYDELYENTRLQAKVAALEKALIDLNSRNNG